MMASDPNDSTYGVIQEVKCLERVALVSKFIF